MSVLGRKWDILDHPHEFESKVFSPKISGILSSRGIKTQQDINEFLRPYYEKESYNPLLLKGMSEAIEVIDNAIQNKDHILIYGDYDADGVCASIILKDTLCKLGVEQVEVYIPHREEEGYGMNIEALKTAFNNGVDLVITVDCGSTNFKEAKYCCEQGMKLVITDHHTVLKEKPVADAFINPHQEGDEYPFKNISGTAVAFKLACSLLDYYRENYRADIQIGWEKWFLDLVAISTITDVMPATGENRTLIYYGLMVLAKTKRAGLQALKAVCNISSNDLLTSHTLGFLLGPRINAAGRMKHAQLAFNLLDAQDKEKAFALAREIDHLNRERQKLVDKILKSINQDMIEKEAIVLGSPDWPIGVLGIVAGRLSDQYGKPAFIYQVQNSNIVGSARAPEHCNVVRVLEQCSDILKKFGGHSQAGGFTADIDFEKEFNKKIMLAVKKDSKKSSVPCLKIDYDLTQEAIDKNFFTELIKLQPFGVGNENPIFMMKNITISDKEIIGRNNSSMRVIIIDEKGSTYKGLGFGLAKYENIFNIGDKADIVFCFIIENGASDLPELEIIDIRKHNEN